MNKQRHNGVKPVSIALAFILCFALAACSDAGTSPSAAPEGTVSYTPYNTQGLIATPAIVNTGANQLADEDLIAMYKDLYAQALKMYRMSDFFELDENDVFQPATDFYYAITNFGTREEIIRNYEAVFSYNYFQRYIYPVMFIHPFGPFDNDYPLIHEDGGKLYLCMTQGGVMGNDTVDDSFTRIISKEPDRFQVETMQEILPSPVAEKSYQPYVLTIVNQNGLWVLDNFYWFEVW